MRASIYLIRPEGGAKRHGAAVPEAERSGAEGYYK